ncbi:MAG: GNAT family N-acetyltransferase [Acidimicrobiales bacterium]
MAHSSHTGRHEHVLSDGTRTIVRPIELGDGDKLRAAFEHLSPESRYRRFFTAMPRLSETMVHHLLDVDGVDRAAWVALDAEAEGEPGVGVARYYRLEDQPDAAEMAVAVVDDYQHRGIGSLLLRHLSGTARAQGIKRFVGTVLAQNRPMLDLIESADGKYTLDEPGVLRLEIDVPGVPDAESDERPGVFTLLRAAARWR